MHENRQLVVINTHQWIAENEASFAPPVCNKLMHNEQLVVMFVGGPNQREDYHIEEGEELFYQIKGDMCVKILENGAHRDVHIKQGELFILPGRIPHSPQRTANSIGLVIERKRAAHEIDGVRWFVPNSSSPLYEKWFHCKDLGVELVPLIKKFFASEEYRTKQPKDNIVEPNQLPFELNSTVLDRNKHGAYNLRELIDRHVASVRLNLTPAELKLQFDVEILKLGKFEFELAKDLDMWLWQLDGQCQIELRGREDVLAQKLSLSMFDSLLVPANFCGRVCVIQEDSDSSLMRVLQHPRLVEK